MRLFRKILKEAIKPTINIYRGRVGEAQVNSKLNPVLSGKIEHKQINNLILVDDNGKSHQIDHVDIRENGIFCIETKNYKGWIYGTENQDRWTQTLFTEKNQFLNPIKQNKSHIYHLSRALKNKYKINSLVVFTQNNADKIDIPNVINLNELKQYLKNYNANTHYTKEDIDNIYAELQKAHNGEITNRSHVQNIIKTQYELRSGICPRCGGNIVEKTGKYGTFYGCDNYPKCTFVLKK